MEQSSIVGRDERSGYAILRHAPVAIAVVGGPNHIFTFANQQYEQLFGKDSGSIIGRSIKDIWPELEGQGVIELFDHVFTSFKPVTVEKFSVTFILDGREKTGYYDFSISCIPKTDGGPQSLLVLAVDVTSHILSENKFRTLAENLPDLITRHDQQFRYEYANHYFEKFTGIKAKDVLGKTYWELGMPEKLCRFFDEHLGVAFSTKKMHTVEFYVSEQQTWILSRLVPEIDSHGHIMSVLVISSDISRHKAREAELHFIATMSSNIAEAVIATDTKFKIVSWNRSAENLYGWASSEVIGKSIDSVIETVFTNEDDIVSAAQSLKKIGVWKGEVLQKTRSGQFVSMLSSVSSVKNSEGEEIGSIAINRDITEIKHKEQKIWESKEQLQLALEAAKMGTWTFNLEKNRLDISDELRHLLGVLDSRPITFEMFIDSIVQEDRDRVLKENLDAMSLKDEKCDYQSEFRCKGIDDGVIRWIKAKGKVYVNEAKLPVKFAGAALDITTEKIAQEKLFESEERFRNIAETAPVFVWIVNHRMELTYANSEMLDFVRLSVNEINQNGFESFIHPDDFESVAKQFQLHEPYAMEIRIRNGNNGSFEWFLFKGSPRFFSNRDFDGFIGSASNINSIKGFLSELERQVADRTSELNKVNVQLRQSNEDLEQFAHVTSHDLKEPVRKILLFANRIQDENRNQLPDKSQNDLSKILRSAYRMDAMITGVLAYSTLKLLTEQKKEVDLNYLVDGILDDLEVLIAQKEATVYKETLPTIFGDEVLLYQLFYNLINNALKFSRPSTCIIRITSIQQVIDNIPSIVLQITDNGIGFESEYANEIFEAFKRLHSKDKYEGTGLGLALCKKIVDRHGGSISAWSRVGEGAVFTVKLPIGQLP